MGVDIHAGNDHVLGLSCQRGYFDIVRLLVEHGANIKADNNNALRATIFSGQIVIFNFLAEKDVDVDFHINDEFLLRSACCYGRLEIVKYLVDKGANIYAQNDYALQYATRNNYYKIVDYLAIKYIEAGKFIPDHVITYCDDDSHRILFEYAEPSQYVRFGFQSKRETCKSARNI